MSRLHAQEVDIRSQLSQLRDGLVAQSTLLPPFGESAPDFVSFQSFLTDAAGMPLDTTVSVTTTFYKSGVAGYSQLHTNVSVEDGNFKLVIGPVDTVKFDQPIDLGITIGVDPEMTPRATLYSVPFALGLRGFHAYEAYSTTLDTSYNVIANPSINHVGPDVTGATISGGGGWYLGGNPEPNSVTFTYGTIGGGSRNTVTAYYGTIGGGFNNGSGFFGTVGGGASNSAPVQFSTVGGGLNNSAPGEHSTVGGGYSNSAPGQRSTVGGGDSNQGFGAASSIAGGYFNNAQGDSSSIGGGARNSSAGWLSTIGGGHVNVASGLASTVPGGAHNHAGGDLSFAAGQRARSIHANSFVWSDGSMAASGVDSLVTSAPNQFLAKAIGGVTFYSNEDITTGVHLAPGTGAWAAASDVNSKTAFNTTNPIDVLNRLSRVPIRTWRYKGQDESITHMGPTAQEFYDAFGLGIDDRHIVTVDADGVAFAAIQGLYELVKEQQVLLQTQNSKIEALQRLIGGE